MVSFSTSYCLLSLLSPSPSSLSSSCSISARSRAPPMATSSSAAAPPRLVVACSSPPRAGSFPEPPNLGPQRATFSHFGLSANEDARLRSSYKWQRVLLKVSGEALAGDHTQNIDPTITMSIAREVASVTRLGIEVAVVVGGGNIFRGASWAGCSGLDRSSADYIGFSLQSEDNGTFPTYVLNMLQLQRCSEKFDLVFIFVHEYSVGAEVVLKATNVDGVFDEDPKHNPNACLLETLSYQEVTTRDLSVMDMTAITLCQENNIPVVVFNLNKPGNIAKAIVGEKVGTFIGGTTRNLQLQYEGSF
ncbi:Uridylate kinase [Ananas comosus]|uniref:UMP kinase n=1 Tax=Ananas comosus TaxID=4615 RepID=A0A199UL60_ANACO|nr:Uridylate kinase [Ananas comosus]